MFTRIAVFLAIVSTADLLDVIGVTLRLDSIYW